jgi:transcriptional regulator with XRE-family HTH domain
MQGVDLKRIRKSLGWTQGDLARALGLSSTFVGLMERGAKPIEPRTRLALLYLQEHPDASEKG